VAGNPDIRCLAEHGSADCGHGDQHLTLLRFTENTDKKATLDLAHPKMFPVIRPAELNYADIFVYLESRGRVEPAHVVETLKSVLGHN
jgi:hypothetical protein